MPIFHYEAKDQTGKTLVGSMTGKDEGFIRARLIQNGYTPVLVEEPSDVKAHAAGPRFAGAGATGAASAPFGSSFTPRRGRRPSVLVPSRVQAQFYGQMAGMVKSGVPLPQALAQITSSTRDRHLRTALADIEATVSRGRPMSEAMDRHPRVFSAGQIGLVRSGESAGFLDRAFTELANQAEANWGVGTMSRFNPILFLLKMVGFPFLVMWIVFMSNMPKWQADASQVGYYLGHAAIIAGGSLVLLIVFFPTLSYLVRLSPLGQTAENIAAVIPGFSARSTRVNRVKTLGALSSALNAGVPLSLSWELAAEAADTDRVHRLMEAQMPEIKRGGTIPDAMERTGLFTEQIIQMARSGELSGNLPDMLTQAITFEREEAKQIGMLMPWVIAVGAYLIFIFVAGYLVIRAASSVYGGMAGGLGGD